MITIATAMIMIYTNSRDNHTNISDLNNNPNFSNKSFSISNNDNTNKSSNKNVNNNSLFSKKNIFTCKKFTNLVREKYSLLQLDHKKLNYTQIHTEKKWTKQQTNQKRKIRQFAQQILKEGPVESQLALSSNLD